MKAKQKMTARQKARTLSALFFSFFKIGICTFGGGYAMIPLIQKEAGEKRGWITDGDMLEILAVAESTPGPIAINSATFIGERVAGFWGAFCATLGVSLPSFLILLLLSHVLALYQHLKPVRYAFFGIRSGVLALMVKALYSLYRQCPKDLFSILLMIAVLLGAVAAHLFGFSVLYFLLGAALFGLCYAFIRAKRGKI